MHHSSSVIHRHGVTLIEIVLVMAIIAFMASLALPNLDRLFASQKVDKAAEIVRSQMGHARVEAIRNGKVYAFVYNEGQSQLAVRQFDQLVAAGSIDHFVKSNAEDQRDGNLDYSNENLPRGVRFVAGQALSDVRSQFETASAGETAGKMKPILFYPDGSSQDAQLVLMNERGDSVRIILRGLTGSTRVTRTE